MKNILFFMSLLMLASCVPQKKVAELQARFNDLQANSDKAMERARQTLADCDRRGTDFQADLRAREADVQNKNAQIKGLQEQLDYLKSTNNNLLDRLSDLSVVSKAGADNIKQSLETLNLQTKYIKNLNSSVQRKDSINLALVMNLKRSLENINDEDVQVEVKKGVVYVSISDKLLFTSGQADLNIRAEEVLEKVARVINDHNELDVLVEGHTDNVPIVTSCYRDNWDLSAKRATTVVRVLQTKFGVKPERLTAGGRAEFAPKDVNETELGRRANRRTEIILTPKLDQFFQLLQQPAGSK